MTRHTPRRDETARPALPQRAAIVVLSFAATLFLVLIWHDLSDAWFNPGNQRRVMGKLAIYWCTWLLWPALPWLAWRGIVAARRGLRVRAGIAALALAACATATWARFIEPTWLQVRETNLGGQCGVSVALVSDIHMGLYMREDDLRRIVDKLNGLPVDAVLVAGDWTYEPSHDLARVFAPLADLRHPVIAVMGNHDEESPGPPLTADLRQALSALKVQLIDGRRMPFGRCELIGVGDLTAGSAYQDIARLKTEPSAQPPARRVLLAHNPDVALDLPPDFAALTLAGHTHGGQINLPYYTRRLLSHVTRGGFAQGLYETPKSRLFVTPGVGMDILPFRFRVPPTIDVLAL